MTSDGARDDLLVSVCFADAGVGTAAFPALRQLAQKLGARFRFWEILLLVDADRAQASEALAQLPNLRRLVVRRGTSFYRRRLAVASEAIGDIVVLGSLDELPGLDLISMIEQAEAGHIVVARRAGASLLNPALRALGSSAGFRADARDMLTSAYPRTLLNRLLAHPDRLLALRFPPADDGLPVVVHPCAERASGRSLVDLGRRLNLAQRLLVSSAPRVLTLVALLSLLVAASALAFAGYAVVVWLTFDTVQPGWFTTSMVLSLTAFFLGCAIFGLSVGLQKLLEVAAVDIGGDIVDEGGAVDLFAQVLDELNVDTGARLRRPAAADAGAP